MPKHSLALLVAALAVSGCVGGDSDGGATQVGAAPLGMGSDALFGAAKTTEARLLDCQLAYESFAPSFVSRTAANFESTFGQLDNQGMAASDGAFTLVVATNPGAPYDLPLVAQIFDERSDIELSYDARPSGGGYLVDIGARIAPVELDGVVFDHLRARCSIRPL